ncbi:Ion channel [Oesophagostomum dentatum]|uniref:Ion channel n=1 Tax=Oesophagostomum dentatum TaxID=61180 RepID=A0A0B1TP89_OESDE|nr:Ion channel [Oesophagostomum dentatum]
MRGIKEEGEGSDTEISSTNDGKATKIARKFLRFRSHSFSEVPKRKVSTISGTAKDRAMYGRENPMAKQKRAKSFAANADQDKAVNDYYERHPPVNGVNEKSYDALEGFTNSSIRSGIQGTPLIERKDTIAPPPPSMRKFNSSVYWVLHNRSKYGFRHMCMLLLVLSYTMLGAAMFFTIESAYERATVARRKVALDATVEKIAEHMMRLQNGTVEPIDIRTAEDFVKVCSSSSASRPPPAALIVRIFKRSYIELLVKESLFDGSTYHKHSDSSIYKWTYASAVFFCMNLYTTTGYGSIAPETTLGRSCAILYSLITIPITLVVIRDLGQWTLVMLTKLYAHILVLFRRSMGYEEPNEDSMISLPIKFCLSLLASYLLASATFIYFFDDWCGEIPHTGVSFFIAFYFSYISISTIGLGDIMPNNATFHPLISAIFFFGMPVMKVVNRATYICIENGVFGAFTLLERSIDRLSSKIEPTVQPASPRVRRISRCSYCSHINYEDNPEEDKATELLNNLTIRSLATFARANADVYGGGFGRVNLRKGDLVQSKTSLNQGPSSP